MQLCFQTRIYHPSSLAPLNAIFHRTSDIIMLLILTIQVIASKRATTISPSRPEANQDKDGNRSTSPSVALFPLRIDSWSKHINRWRRVLTYLRNRVERIEVEIFSNRRDLVLERRESEDNLVSEDERVCKAQR